MENHEDQFRTNRNCKIVMNVEAVKQATSFIQSEFEEAKPKRSVKKSERIVKYQFMFHSKTLMK